MMPLPRPAALAAGWLILCAATAAAQQTSVVYDVTIAGLQRFQDADITQLTPATVTMHIDGDTFMVHRDSPPPGRVGT